MYGAEKAWGSCRRFRVCEIRQTMVARTLFLQIGRRLGIHVEYCASDKRLSIHLSLSNSEYLIEICIFYYYYLDTKLIK